MDHHVATNTEWIHLAPLVFSVLLLAAYLTLVASRRRTLHRWPMRRTAVFCTGCLLLGVVFWPNMSEWSITDFRGHMVQHLVVGMAAPLLLVLGAPITLFVGSVPTQVARFTMRLMRTRFVWLLTRPPVALALAVGPMAALYFTPLYGWVTASAWSHVVLHAHFLAAGYLFAWVIAGPDPAPHRAGVKGRIVTIGVAVVVHAAVSQFMFAGVGLEVVAPAEHIRDGAALMYFGGDLIEILLALALLATWRTSRQSSTSGRATRRSKRVLQAHRVQSS